MLSMMGSGSSPGWPSTFRKEQILSRRSSSSRWEPASMLTLGMWNGPRRKLTHNFDRWPPTRSKIMKTELSQRHALYLTKSEADRLLANIHNATFLVNRAIEVYLEPAEPIPMQDGSKLDA